MLLGPGKDGPFGHEKLSDSTSTFIMSWVVPNLYIIGQMGPGTVHHETEVVYLGMSNSGAREHRAAAWAWAGSSGLLMAPTTMAPVFLPQLTAVEVWRSHYTWWGRRKKPDCGIQMRCLERYRKSSQLKEDWWIWLFFLRRKRTNLKLHVYKVMGSDGWLGWLIRALEG